MKKSYYLNIIALLGICTIYSQDAINTEEKDRANPLLKYDWSDIGTMPNVIGKKTYTPNVDSDWNLSKTIDNSAAVGSLNYLKSASSISKMPVYEPKGIYKMRVIEIDSTKHFYLRIYKPH